MVNVIDGNKIVKIYMYMYTIINSKMMIFTKNLKLETNYNITLTGQFERTPIF